jgi:hypothetical protein
MVHWLDELKDVAMVGQKELRWLGALLGVGPGLSKATAMDGKMQRKSALTALLQYIKIVHHTKTFSYH